MSRKKEGRGYGVKRNWLRFQNDKAMTSFA